MRKEAGMTAHDVVARVRRIIGIKQVGHSGTLDPMATGVLPIAIGQATRLIRFLADDKVYRAEILFGLATTTDDIEGDELESCETMPGKDQVIASLEKFKGDIEQYPPLYSAVHVGGKRLYQLARKGEIPAEIPLRQVKVHQIDSLGWKDQNFDGNISRLSLSLRIHCGSGTYIRSIARDLGQTVDSPACLFALERERVGAFAIEDSVTLNQLNDAVSDGSISSLIQKPETMLSLEKVELDSAEAKKLVFGQRVGLQTNTIRSNAFIMAMHNGRLVGICSVVESTKQTQGEQESTESTIAGTESTAHTVLELKPEVILTDGIAK